MANTYTEVIPKLLAQGLMALRENAVIPQLVNRAYESTAGRKGSTIDVPIPSALTAAAVTPGHAPTAGQDSAPTSVPIPLDQWFEATFFLTDKEVLEVMEGTIPMQASEAVKAIGNNVDQYLLGLSAGFAGAVGTAGTTPFTSPADTTYATDARKVLHQQLAPMDDRRFVLDPDAEAAALGIRAFQDASWAASSEVIKDAKLNRKLGFNWFMDQNVAMHTAGGASGHIVNGTMALGTKSLVVDGGSGTLNAGDVITIAGDTTKYVVAAAFTGAAGTITLTKGLRAVPADNAVITYAGDHVANPVFHRDAIAFATRPLESSSFGLGNFRAETDPVTGLTLRLEIERQHKQTKFSYDILYGAAVVRPEFGVKLMG